MTNKEQIKKSNEEVIRKMKVGESLAVIPPSATWFPPRAVIVKDIKEVKKLFGGDNGNQ
jgi:hypothetical protein